MRFDVITLFPELFVPFLTSGVTRRAYESGLLDVKFWNPRDFSEGNYRRVEFQTYKAQPIIRLAHRDRHDIAQVARANLDAYNPNHSQILS